MAARRPSLVNHDSHDTFEQSLFLLGRSARSNLPVYKNVVRRFRLTRQKMIPGGDILEDRLDKERLVLLCRKFMAL